jgi:hypothetical protein
MKRKLYVALASIVLVSAAALAFGQSLDDPDPAMSAPDALAWKLFTEVNANAGGGNAEFETWASDTDTFRPNPVFPGGAVHTLALHAPALVIAARILAQKKHQTLPAIPPGGDFSEESRRNRATFDFIVSNNLYRMSGLQAAFGKSFVHPISIGAIEVKANWIPVTKVFTDTTYKGTAADIPKFFHVNTVRVQGSPENGKQYALVAMHIISKQVPNWTWATFESRFNPKRCDLINCIDTFGASPAITKSNDNENQGYADCAKTTALNQMLDAAKLEGAFENYCLKGTQTDFTDNTGMAARLGNSVTERGRVATSSCMTCHGMAGWDVKGQSNGFDFALGPTNPSLYWQVSTPTPSTANYPYVGVNVTRLSTSADFIWAIPFCAYDDVTDPKKPQPSPCIANGS